MTEIRRRHFIGGSAASLLVATAFELPCLPAWAASLPQGDYAFFDDRFEAARRIAASWTVSMGPVAVQGDVTPWSDLLDRASRERALQLRGITTESFRFCTTILVGDHASLDLKVSRLDRDLVLWTLRTTPKPMNANSAGRFHG
jgi:hypothetical protein